jgi:cytochrome c-type biogenesis protein CcmF
MLYLGYVGFSVPFAFALGALMMRYPGEKWIKITRVWTIVTWLFLTCGIFLGMHWAYAVLGWGGYWGWDPVENASFMPWLTGTAFLHSVMMQEKKGMMKSWNVWLIFSTFLLTLLGTLLTRAGLVSSVHAFAQSSIGSWFSWFMGHGPRRLHLHLHPAAQTTSKPSITSSPSSAANPASSSTTSSCSPPASSSSGERSSPSSANTSSATKSPSARPGITASPFPSACSCSSSPASARCFRGARHLCEHPPQLRHSHHRPLGHRHRLPRLRRPPWKTAPSTTATSSPWSALPYPSPSSPPSSPSSFAEAGVISRQTGKNLLVSTWLLCRRNTRRYGGYIIHIGVVIVVVGLCGSAFNRNVEKRTRPPRQAGHRPLHARKVGFTQDSNLNYNSDYASSTSTKTAKSSSR